MEYRQLGTSDLKVSVVSLGCNNFGGNPMVAPSGTVYGALDLERTREVVDAALDCGVNFFDTADVYGSGGSERFLGEIVRGRRSRAVIGTKWGSGLEGRPEIAWGSRAYVRQALHASLERLGTDYVDLYQMHWPDLRTPLEETLAALDELVQEGKIRCIGSSHFDGWQLADADWIARSRGLTRFVAAQNHYSLLERSADAELLPACRHFEVGLLAYFPLENGLLTGKYRRGQPVETGRLVNRTLSEATYDLIEALAAYAEARSISMLDVAIGALVAKSGVASVITGATRPAQIIANVAAANWQPTAADLAELDRLLATQTAADTDP